MTWVLLALGLPIIFALAVVWLVARAFLFIARVLGELAGAMARSGRA
jgi:hypothetical protein